MDFLPFILVSAGIIMVPGPNVLVVVATSISSGKLRGLQTVAGTSAAMGIQLLFAALASASLVASLASGFYWLKWAGVIYLFYLGVHHLLSMQRARSTKSVTALGSFQRGFWVSLTNPKTILFFSAFLPQFAVAEQPFLPQIVQLSAIFWLLALLLDSGYALLASKLAGLLKSDDLNKYQDGLSASLYLGAGAALAATRTGQ